MAVPTSIMINDYPFQKKILIISRYLFLKKNISWKYSIKKIKVMMVSSITNDCLKMDPIIHCKLSRKESTFLITIILRSTNKPTNFYSRRPNIYIYGCQTPTISHCHYRATGWDGHQMAEKFSHIADELVILGIQSTCSRSHSYIMMSPYYSQLRPLYLLSFPDHCDAWPGTRSDKS